MANVRPDRSRAFAKSADISILANARHVRRALFGNNFVTFSDRDDRRGRRGRPPMTAAGPPTAGGRESDRGERRGERRGRTSRSTAGRPPVALPAVVIFPKK